MTEESVVAMWAGMTSWFTPTSLFLFLNLMIGTIALSSRFTSQKNPNQQPGDNPTGQLFRASSLIQRVKSISFSLNRFESSEQATILQRSEVVEEQTQLARAPSILNRVKSFNFSFRRYEQSEAAEETQAQHPNMNTDPESDQYTDNPATKAELESYRAETNMMVSVTEKPETKPNSGEAPTKMKRSASEKLMFWRAEEEEEEENVERRRPATVREEEKKRGGASETVSSGDDGCVDDKADDFINRFRNQLKLQRLDSMLRYKEMITRGSSR